METFQAVEIARDTVEPGETFPKLDYTSHVYVTCPRMNTNIQLVLVGYKPVAFVTAPLLELSSSTTLASALSHTSTEDALPPTDDTPICLA